MGSVVRDSSARRYDHCGRDAGGLCLVASWQLWGACACCLAPNRATRHSRLVRSRCSTPSCLNVATQQTVARVAIQRATIVLDNGSCSSLKTIRSYLRNQTFVWNVIRVRLRKIPRCGRITFIRKYCWPIPIRRPVVDSIPTRNSRVPRVIESIMERITISPGSAIMPARLVTNDSTNTSRRIIRSLKTGLRDAVLASPSITDPTSKNIFRKRNKSSIVRPAISKTRTGPFSKHLPTKQPAEVATTAK